MITLTEQIKKLLEPFSKRAQQEILDLAWDACRDGELLAAEYPGVDYDPWDGEHETEARVIELDMVIASIEIEKRN